jgi:plasmid rolling circle replication initiator protein Rep
VKPKDYIKTSQGLTKKRLKKEFWTKRVDFGSNLKYNHQVHYSVLILIKKKKKKGEKREYG